MKMKLNLGEGGIKGFLARHCEKIVFGVALLLALGMIFTGRKNSPLDESQYGPEALRTKANNATQKLGADSWPVIKAERFNEPDNFQQRNLDAGRVSPDAYPAPLPLAKPLFPLDKKRKDPTLYPPENLELVVDYGALATVDPKDARLGGGGGLPGRGLFDAAAGENSRPLPPEVQRELEQSGALVSISGASSKPTFVVKLAAEIPIRKQKLEYDRVFREAADYKPQRDTPHYGADQHPKYGMYYFAVVRAEVAPDGAVGPFNYIRYSTHSMEEQETWAEVPGGEIVDPAYTNPNFTAKLPPLMLRDLKRLATHSNVPLARDMTAETPIDEREVGPAEVDDGPDAGPGVGPRPEVGPGVGPRPAPGPRDDRLPVRRPPRGFPGEFGMEGGGMPRAEEAKVWLFRFYDTNVQPGKSYVYKVKLYLEDPNNPRTSTAGAAAAPVRGDVRFAAEGGEAHDKPPTHALDKSVINRLRDEVPAGQWWRETPYSEPSPVIHIPNTSRVLAGAVDNGKVTQPNNKDFEIRRSEKMANVMILDWAKDKGLDVPGIVQAPRGAVLNYKKLATTPEAIDPFKSALVEMPEHEFKTDNILLDIRGGESLGKSDQLTVPGEMLVLDENGRLVVHSELEDRQSYHKYNYPPPPKEPETPDAGELPPEGPRPPGRRPPRGEEVDIFR